MYVLDACIMLLLKGCDLSVRFLAVRLRGVVGTFEHLPPPLTPTGTHIKPCPCSGKICIPPHHKEGKDSQRTGVPSKPGRFCDSCALSGGESGVSEYSSVGDIKGEDDETPGSSASDIAKGLMVEVVVGSKSWTPSRKDGRCRRA